MNAYRFFRAIYADNRLRRQNRRALARDLALYARNRALRPLERALVARYRDPAQPLVFIVGAPRSGTTLLSQLVARHLDVGYVPNAVARYWMAPVFGLLRHLRRYGERRDGIPLRSAFGGTEGPCSPHEFGWFWSHWCGFFPTDDLAEAELDRFDWDALRAELEGLAGCYARPLVLKSLNHVVYHVARVARELPQSRFIHIRRELPYVVRSILECRVARYGDERRWWTIRPRDVADWLDRPPVEQVCHQVVDIRRAIETALAGLPEERRLTLEYEDLVAQPARALRRVAAFVGRPALRDEAGLAALSLASGNVARVDDELFAAIAELKAAP